MCNIIFEIFLEFMVFVLKYCYTVFSNRGGRAKRDLGWMESVLYMEECFDVYCGADF